jgi:predicted nuclease with RNAse H fold
VIAAGIDLSGRTVGVTAIAWVEGERPRVTRLEAKDLRGGRGDDRVCALLREHRPAVVALDAPLQLPHPVTCEEEACPICFPEDGVAPSYGARTVDRPEAWKGIGHRERSPMPTVMLAGIAFRAIYLARLLRRAGLEVIETWPMGVYRALARGGEPVPAHDGSDAWRRATLSRTVAGVAEQCPEGAPHERDLLDAAAAAYAGWCHLAGDVVEVQGLEGEGSIVVPHCDHAGVMPRG